MNVRFKKTGAGEVAILPRKEYEALLARANEAEEDAGTARVAARAREQIAAGPLFPACSPTGSSRERTRSVSCASGGMSRSFISRTRPGSDRAIFPIWNAAGARV